MVTGRPQPSEQGRGGGCYMIPSFRLCLPLRTATVREITEETTVRENGRTLRGALGPSRRSLLTGTAAGLSAAALTPRPRSARAEGQSLRIGVLNDQSGPYADIEGRGSVIAAQMAIEDFGGSVLGRKIEILVGDHQNRPDVGATIARQWLDVDGVELIDEVGSSAVALAVQEIVRQKNKVVLFGAVGTDEITQRQCSPNGIAWLYDSHSLASGPPPLLIRQGFDTWFFLTVDFNFGHSMQTAITSVLLANGGKVVGTALFPQNTSDFGSIVIQASASKAKVVCLIASGADNINVLKQADEFGLKASGATITVPLLWITDVHGMGLGLAQGLTFMETFYWDRNEGSRSWSRRFFARHRAMPTGDQVSVYSSILHYLRAVASVGKTDAQAVIGKMRDTPVNDVFAQNGWIREDMRLMHDFYLARVKAPSKSKGPWDYYEIVETIPAESAFGPLVESLCPLVKKG